MAHAGACPICAEPVEPTSGDPALCGACSQPLHEVCLQSAVAVDSRCPFCREDLATVGYTVGSIVAHPQLRRFRGDGEHFGVVMGITAEISAILHRMKQLKKRAERMCDGGRSLLEVRINSIAVLLADTAALKLCAEALLERCSSLPGDLRQPSALIRSALATVNLLTRICKVIREKRDIEASACQHKQTALGVAIAKAKTRLRRPAAALPVLRRPAAAKSHVRRRPAAAKSEVRRRPAAIGRAGARR